MKFKPRIARAERHRRQLLLRRRRRRFLLPFIYAFSLVAANGKSFLPLVSPAPHPSAKRRLTVNCLGSYITHGRVAGCGLRWWWRREFRSLPSRKTSTVIYIIHAYKINGDASFARLSSGFFIPSIVVVTRVLDNGRIKRLDIQVS